MDGGMVAWKVVMSAALMAAAKVEKLELRMAVGLVEEMVVELVE